MSDQPTFSLCAVGVRVGYGNRDVLSSLNLCIQQGEIQVVIGHNGAGKSTLLKTLGGVLAIRDGDIKLGGESIARYSPGERINRGISYLPQGNPVFSRLSVYENLRIRLPSALTSTDARRSIHQGLESFPSLKERENQAAGSLSGGEKQMLALAGALLTQPRFLLLDEPSTGLAPFLVSSAFGRLRQLSREKSVGILMVEQRIREAVRICDRLVVMRQGKVTFEGSAQDIAGDETRIRDLYL